MANMDISILTLSNETAWRAYVRSHPATTIYHTLEWRDILYNEYKFEPVYIMAREGEKIVGIFPLFLVKNIMGKRLVSLPFSIYGGPVCDSKEVVNIMINWACRECDDRKIDSLMVRTGMKQMPGFHAGKAYVSSILNIHKDTEAIWNGLRYNTRTAIRRGRASGLSVGFELTDDAISAFYTLQIKNRRRQGLPAPSLRYYRSIIAGLKDKCWLAIVRQDKKPLGGGLFLTFKDSVLFAQGASDYGNQNYRPNDLLVWEVVRWAKENGFKKFDFGLTPVGDEDLLFFKRKWGSESTAWHDLVYPDGYSAERAGIVYAAGGAAFRRLPLWLSAKVGGAVIKWMG